MPIMKKMTMMTKNKKMMIIMEMILALMKMKKMIMENEKEYELSEIKY